MEKTSKYHIYDQNHSPLCWTGYALEFNTFQSAERFIRSIDSLIDRDIIDNAIIVDDILFWDGGYIDASNLVAHYLFIEDEVYLKNVDTGEFDYM